MYNSAPCFFSSNMFLRYIYIDTYSSSSLILLLHKYCMMPAQCISSPTGKYVDILFLVIINNTAENILAFVLMHMWGSFPKGQHV